MQDSSLVILIDAENSDYVNLLMRFQTKRDGHIWEELVRISQNNILLLIPEIMDIRN